MSKGDNNNLLYKAIKRFNSIPYVNDNNILSKFIVTL